MTQTCLNCECTQPLSATCRRCGKAMRNRATLPQDESQPVRTAVSVTARPILPLSVVERKAIERALKVFNGRQDLAAKALEINVSTIARKVKRYGLRGR